jgi:adenosine deaminase
MSARPPLIDLHRHLDGSVRLQTILDLGRQHGIPLPGDSLEELKPHVVVSTPQPGLIEFLAKFRWMTGVLADYDACRRVARENVEDAQREGIRYLELRFSPLFMADAHNLDPSMVTAAVIEGVREGEAATGVKANLIGILTRTYGPVRARRELRALLDHRKEIVALDLAGDERPGARCGELCALEEVPQVGRRGCTLR